MGSWQAAAGNLPGRNSNLPGSYRQNV